MLLISSYQKTSIALIIINGLQSVFFLQIILMLNFLLDMELNLIFSAIVYLLILVLLVCIVKVILDIQDLSIKGKGNHLNLQKALQTSKEENKMLNNKISLIVGLYETLFNRLFIINKELILVQKLFFDKRN